MTPFIYTDAPPRATKTPLFTHNRRLANFARQAVFTEFGARFAKALDQGNFVDRVPDARMRLAPGARFQK